MFQEPAWLRPLLPAPEGRVSLGAAPERRPDMRQLSIALGACVAAVAVTAGPALAQNSTPSTYQAARAAGAAAQKVAPPNLVLPADMGGGTYSQRMTSPNSTTTTMPADTTPATPPDTSTTTTTPTTPTTPSSPNTKPGG